MRRLPAEARPDWQDRIAAQGMTYWQTTTSTGAMHPYWWEDAYYELAPCEVDYLEMVTEMLHGMCLEAAKHLASGEFGDLGLSPGSLEAARAALEHDPPSLYGRFDLCWDGTDHAKLLEYNADTPTGLLEASVIQWYWLQDSHPDKDQWNSLHERLILAWQKMAPRLVTSSPVYFAHHRDEPTGEELMTATYLRDTADQAGLATESIEIGEIGYDPGRACFVGHGEELIRTCFKLYPWEDMLDEQFGAIVKNTPPERANTTWLEPVWKVLLSNKALLVALWQIYPNQANLLPAYLDSPGPLTQWVAKPLHGREGDNIRVEADGVRITNPGDYGAEGYCYQQWHPLPDFDGNRMVLGTWVVDGRAAGLGIRESGGPITDYYARFVPHLIDADAPTEQTRTRWLVEDFGANAVAGARSGQPMPAAPVDRHVAFPEASPTGTGAIHNAPPQYHPAPATGDSSR